MKLLRVYIALLAISLTTILNGAEDVDVNAVLNARLRLVQSIAFMDKHPDIFPTKKASKAPLLTREQHMICWQTWQTFMDRIVSLDRQESRYYKLYKARKGKEKSRAFCLRFEAFLVQYRFALEFIRRIELNPELTTILNEEAPELGLKKGTYSDLKLRFLNVAIATRFARLTAQHKLHNSQTGPLAKAIELDKRYIWKAGGSHGSINTVKNAAEVAKGLTFKAWFPVQKEVSEWMGDTKVWRFKKSLLTDDQVLSLQNKLKPGDILLVRHEWYLSNIGLPGFWPHAALYVGTPDERREYFDDPKVKKWLMAKYKTDDLEALLKSRFPKKYEKSISKDSHNHTYRVIEAISEGVSLTTLHHCLDVDCAAALRPRAEKTVKVEAMIRAFHYCGRPYDFNFDFQTDSSIVCTELVYKSYEAAADNAGVRFPLTMVLGRNVSTANDMVKMFDQEFGKPKQQLDLIGFYDGFEWEKKCILRDAAAFCKTYKRPKWHIWLHRPAKK